MPKSTPTFSPTSHGKQPLGDSSRMSDVALRKKKNADAQAAFRARRANYIATLEETVTSLESVVLQLQESCRETKTESLRLQQENSRLRADFRERENFWRALWQAKKSGQDVEPGELPASIASSISSSPTVKPGTTHYDSTTLSYPQAENTIPSNTSFGVGVPYTSSTSFSSGEPSSSPSVDSSHNPTSHCSSRFSPYPYPLHTVRDASWGSVPGQGTSTIEDVAHAPHSGSSNFVESPIMVVHNEMAYPLTRQNHGKKGSLSSLDAAPYVFPSSRSISPTLPTASSSAYSFNSHTQEHAADHDYLRHQPTEITLHNGTADLSSMNSSSDIPRYRSSSQLPATGLHLSTQPRSTPGLQHEGSSSASQARVRFGSRSRSSSPGAPAISGTLAVIKAQAFGALRRTRTRTRKSSDGAAKVALNLLEARGMGVGGSDANHISQHSDDDDSTS